MKLIINSVGMDFREVIMAGLTCGEMQKNHE
jgi:hypothetical protein